MAETYTLYKLIVLYSWTKWIFHELLHRFPEFILDKGYTTYFRLQETLSELTDSELLKIETTHNRTLYRLTETGADTIHFFSNKISPEIRTEIE